jgi:deazaflavin-dependent oxidoreductase (nitroreductase family)
MRLDKRRLTTALANYVFNPLVKAGVATGLLRGWAILETTGRRSGRGRRTPVGNGLHGDTFWIVAEHGRRAAYVRNIEADSRVRVKARGRWRSGTAHVMPEVDPRGAPAPHRPASERSGRSGDGDRAAHRPSCSPSASTYSRPRSTLGDHGRAVVLVASVGEDIRIAQEPERPSRLSSCVIHRWSRLPTWGLS